MIDQELRWNIPSDLLHTSVEIMRPQGARGNEGLALWFGRDVPLGVEITHAIDVFGTGFRTSPLHMSLSLSAMSTLTDLGEKLGRFLVGQIHSHPERFLDLSPLDMRQGIRVPNYLSIVCPYYAQRPVMQMTECGVHVFDRGRYRRLQNSEIDRRLRITSSRTNLGRCEVKL